MAGGTGGRGDLICVQVSAQLARRVSRSAGSIIPKASRNGPENEVSKMIQKNLGKDSQNKSKMEPTVVQNPPKSATWAPEWNPSGPKGSPNAQHVPKLLK